MMAIVHATQKMGRCVYPLLILGIRKHRALVATDSSHRSHGVALPHVCGSGVPVETARSDGVLPFGFPTKHPLVPSRERVQDAFEFVRCCLELFRAPRTARLRYLFLRSLLMRVTHATKLFVAATPVLISSRPLR